MSGFVRALDAPTGRPVDGSPATVADLLARRAESTPDDVVVRFSGVSITASELQDRATRIARGLLSRGLVPGDRVAVLLPNSPEFVELIFACSRAGLVQVPLNAFLKGDFLRHQLADSGAVALVTDAEGAAVARPLLDGIEVRHLIEVGSDYDTLRTSEEDRALPPVRPVRHRGADVHLGNHGPAEGLHAQSRLPDHHRAGVPPGRLGVGR